MATHSWTQHMRPELQLLPFRIDPFVEASEQRVGSNKKREPNMGHWPFWMGFAHSLTDVRWANPGYGVLPVSGHSLGCWMNCPNWLEQSAFEFKNH